MDEIRETVAAILKRRPEADSKWVHSAAIARHPELRNMPLRSFVARYFNPVRRTMNDNNNPSVAPTEQADLSAISASTPADPVEPTATHSTATSATSTTRVRRSRRKAAELDAFRAVVRQELISFGTKILSASTLAETVDAVRTVDQHIDRIAAAWKPKKRTRARRAS